MFTRNRCTHGHDGKPARCHFGRMNLRVQEAHAALLDRRAGYLYRGASHPALLSQKIKISCGLTGGSKAMSDVERDASDAAGTILPTLLLAHCNGWGSEANPPRRRAGPRLSRGPTLNSSASPLLTLLLIRRGSRGRAMIPRGSSLRCGRLWPSLPPACRHREAVVMILREAAVTPPECAHRHSL